MVRIFFDKQGNAQLADEYLEGLVDSQPEVFGIAEITEEDYQKVLSGYKYIDNALVKPTSLDDKELSVEEQRIYIEKQYNNQIEELKDSLLLALLMNDESAINNIREEYQTLKNNYIQMLEGISSDS